MARPAGPFEASHAQALDTAGQPLERSSISAGEVTLAPKIALG